MTAPLLWSLRLAANLLLGMLSEVRSLPQISRRRKEQKASPTRGDVQITSAYANPNIYALFTPSNLPFFGQIMANPFPSWQTETSFVPQIQIVKSDGQSPQSSYKNVRVLVPKTGKMNKWSDKNKLTDMNYRGYLWTLI